MLIFACGYQAKGIPVYDKEGQRIKFRRMGSKISSFEVDSQLKLFDANSNKTVERLFGIGIGYSLRTQDNLV